MNELDKVISIAMQEEGYLEKKSNKDLDDKIKNAGSNNYTKYARDLDNIKNFYNGKKNGYAWCDVFVDWCFVKAFGVDRALELLCQPTKSCGAGVGYSCDYYKAKGQFYTKPQIGDQIFFKNSSGVRTHTGLVYNVDKNYVYTIEGNTSSVAGVVSNGGCVKRKQYKLSSTYIYGYGRPAYKIEEKKETYSGKLPSLPLRGYFKFNPKTPNKIYDVGANVKLLQKFLNWALDTNLVVDGYYGINTGKAVCKFEKVCGITVDYEFGKNCLAKAKSYTK